MKPHTPEYIEGPEAGTRFNAAISKLLSVSRAELLRREEEYKKQAAANPHKRGPKPKAKRRRSLKG